MFGYASLEPHYESQDEFVALQLSKNTLLMGVMDGHDRDGAQIAQHVQQKLLKLLTQKLHLSNLILTTSMYVKTMLS